MSISSEVSRLNSAKTAISAAITEKGVTVPDGTKLDGMAPLIKSISGGGGGTGGGSEEEWIGDGNTHIWIHLGDGRTSPKLGCCPKGTVTVDWGDGTSVDTLTGTSTSTVKWTPTHNYAEPGDYVITLIVKGKVGFLGIDGGSSILNYSSDVNLQWATLFDERNITYLTAVKKIELGGSCVSIDDDAFYQCYGLSSITIPNSIARIGRYAFENCHNLNSVVIPDGITNIDAGAFCFCYGLSDITIPGSVTNIGENAFRGCYGMRRYNFTACTSVPAIDTNVFRDIPADCLILVPLNLYDEWKAETNWSTHADKIIGV